MTNERDYWKIGTIILAIGLIVAVPLALILRSRYQIEIFQGLIGLLFLLIIQIIFLLLYFIPSFVAYKANRFRFWPVLFLNLFLGFTFVGWVLSLVLALWKPIPTR
jgi:hypothetical protein